MESGKSGNLENVKSGNVLLADHGLKILGKKVIFQIWNESGTDLEERYLEKKRKKGRKMIYGRHPIKFTFVEKSYIDR